MFIDGYHLTPNWPAIRTKNNDDWICHEVAAFGRAHKRMLISQGVSEGRIFLVNPPLLSAQERYGRRREETDEFDVIVLSWQPLHRNPLASYSSPRRTLRDALITLKSSGYRNIAVKIRWRAERTYVAALCRELDLAIPILEGPLHTHLHRTSLFVGGISGAVAQVIGADLRYIIFEPEENGYSDSMISKSHAISRSSISRTVDELQNLLLTSATSWLGDYHENLFVK